MHADQEVISGPETDPYGAHLAMFQPALSSPRQGVEHGRLIFSRAFSTLLPSELMSPRLFDLTARNYFKCSTTMAGLLISLSLSARDLSHIA